MFRLWDFALFTLFVFPLFVASQRAAPNRPLARGFTTTFYIFFFFIHTCQDLERFMWTSSKYHIPDADAADNSGADRAGSDTDVSENDECNDDDPEWSPRAVNSRKRRHTLRRSLDATVRKRRQSLQQENTVPKVVDCLVGRNEESQNIREFLLTAIESKGKCGNRNLLVCGVPGSGKTALLRKIIHDLRKTLGNKFLDAEVNCASITSAEQIYSTAVRGMMDDVKQKRKGIAAKDAYEILRALDDMVVLVLDEIDYITSQTVLYNIFDMTIKRRKGIIVIGISNRLNFQDTMKNSIISRISMKYVVFKPYTANELRDIFHFKTGDRNSFGEAAMEFASKSIANISGDVRKMFQLCDISRSKAAKRNSKMVHLSDVLSAKRELYRSAPACVIKSCSKSQQLLIISIIIECREVENGIISIRQVQRKHASLSGQLKCPVPSTVVWNNVLCSTESLGLIQVHGCFRGGTISLNASRKELIDALKQQYTTYKKTCILTRECDEEWDTYFSWINSLFDSI